MTWKEHSTWKLLLALFLGALLSPLLNQAFQAATGSIHAQDADEKSVPDEVSAKRFRLVDDTGMTRALISVTESGASSFVLNDDEGFPRIGVLVDKEATSIALLGPEQEKKRASLLIGTNKDGPAVGLKSGSGGSTLSLDVLNNKTPRVQLTKSGHSEEEEYRMLAGLQCSDQGPVLMLLPPHKAIGDSDEALPKDSILVGRIDTDDYAFGVRYFDGTKLIDWPEPKK